MSPDSVRGYEAGRQIPADETVRAMCEISGLSPLAYWHMCGKSDLAAETLPEVKQLPLAQAACNLVARVDEFYTRCPLPLLRMAADGHISELEQTDFAGILEMLDGVVEAALTLKYAERKP